MAAEILKLPLPSRDAPAAVGSLLASLMRTNPKQIVASDAFALKVQDRSIMLENPIKAKAKSTGGPKPARVRSAKRGVHAGSLTGVTYAGMLPVHELWRRYSEGLAGAEPSEAGIQSLRARLWGAELHGALVRVAACPALPSAEGKRGFVVRNTPTSATIVTPEDRQVRVPKRGSVLELLVGRHVVTLEHGIARAPARKGKA